MSALDGLLAGIVADPLEETRWLVDDHNRLWVHNWLERDEGPGTGTPPGCWEGRSGSRLRQDVLSYASAARGPVG